MPETTISRTAPVKLYDVNGSPSLEKVFVRYSPDGRSITLAKSELHQQYKRWGYNFPCDPSYGFHDEYGYCVQPPDRGAFCNTPIRIVSAICSASKNCSPLNFGKTTQTQIGTGYQAVSYLYYDTTHDHYSLGYKTVSATFTSNQVIDNHIATVKSYRQYNNDGTDVLYSRNCQDAYDCPSGDLIRHSGYAFYLDKAVEDPNVGCSGSTVISLSLWNAIKQEASDYCNYALPTDPPTTQAPTTEPPTTQSTTQAPTTQAEVPTEPPTNETGNFTSIEIAPSTTVALENVTMVEELPPSSQALLTSYATPTPSVLPSTAPTTPANTALGLLGLIAVAPVGLGIVAAVVGAYGIYRWCYPKKDDQDDGVNDNNTNQTQVNFTQE